MSSSSPPDSFKAGGAMTEVRQLFWLTTSLPPPLM